MWTYTINIFTRQIVVCRSLIEKLYQLGSKRMRVVQTALTTGRLFTERRGKHGNQWNKHLCSKILPRMTEHLSMFPATESHYTRNTTSRKYFQNPTLTLLKLFRLFKVYYHDKEKELLPIKYGTYVQYFKKKIHPKYAFRKPRVDRCDFCVEYELKLKADPANASLQRRLTNHLEKFSAYKATKEYLTKNVSKNPRTLTVEMDYGQNLPLPKLSNTSQFYKRLIWMFTFNIHSYEDNDSIFYTYLESEGPKNSASVASYLYTFLMEKLRSPAFAKKKEIIIFSDAAGGQNKNMAISKFLSWFAKKENKTIEQIFPVRGHSYNQCDRNFGLYGRVVKKRQEITHFKTYLKIMATCRNNPFRVLKDASIIRDISPIVNNIRIISQQQKKRDDFKIQRYVRIRYTSDKIEGSCSYNPNYEPFFVKDIPVHIEFKNLPPFATKPINSAKRADVLSLLPYVPEHHQEWFEDVLK